MNAVQSDVNVQSDKDGTKIAIIKSSKMIHPNVRSKTNLRKLKAGKGKAGPEKWNCQRKLISVRRSKSAESSWVDIVNTHFFIPTQGRWVWLCITENFGSQKSQSKVLKLRKHCNTKKPWNTLEILNSFRLIFDLSKLNFLSWLWFLLFLLFSIFLFFLLSTLTEYFVWVEKGKQAVPGYVTRI